MRDITRPKRETENQQMEREKYETVKVEEEVTGAEHC